MDYVGGSSTAGRYLKATSGWYNNGNGTDEYGFSALPGGGDHSGSIFEIVAANGYWWSTSEYEDNSDYAYYRYMNYGYEYAGWVSDFKSNLLSVRCLQD